jgi:hypothetical protein
MSEGPTTSAKLYHNNLRNKGKMLPSEKNAKRTVPRRVLSFYYTTVLTFHEDDISPRLKNEICKNR